MQRRWIPFLLANVVISAAVAFGILTLLQDDGGEPTQRLVTFEVVVTATPDPNYTPPVIIITTTPDPNLPPRANIPPDVLDSTAVASGAPTSTVDPTLLDEEGNFSGSVDQLPEACIQHSLAEGEFPSLVADTYDVNFFDLMAVNGLDEETALTLQIGDVLIVPLPGCPVELFVDPVQIEPEDGAADTEDTTDASDGTDEDTDDPEATEEPTTTPSPTVIPTVTLAPTSASAQVEVVEVIGAGDITTEGVVIRNNGNTVDISGWTLSDADDNTYTFPEGRRLFSGAGVTIFTRAGENTAILFFWGRDTAAFGDGGETGEVVVLRDRDGEVQASLRVP